MDRRSLYPFGFPTSGKLRERWTRIRPSKEEVKTCCTTADKGCGNRRRNSRRRSCCCTSGAAVYCRCSRTRVYCRSLVNRWRGTGPRANIGRPTSSGRYLAEHTLSAINRTADVLLSSEDDQEADGSGSWDELRGLLAVPVIRHRILVRTITNAILSKQQARFPVPPLRLPTKD